MSIKKAIELAGGVGALADLVKVKYQAIQRWRDEGIPADRVLSVCAAVDWAVTPHELAPHLYPNPNDCIPAAYLRKKRRRAA